MKNKKLKLTSDKDNRFVFDNGWILNTEITLVVSNPDKPATVVILNNELFDIRYSKIKIVKADGSPCNTPICIERFIGLIGSEFDGTLSVSNRIFIREESRVKRLDAHENCSLTIEPGTVESFHDYRCLNSHIEFSYAEFVDYVNKLDSMKFKEVPVLYHNEHPFSDYDRRLNRYMRLLEQKQKVRLRFGTRIDNMTSDQKPHKRYTLETDEFSQVFVEAKFLENRNDQKERVLLIRNTTEEYPTTIVVRNCEAERIRIENVRIKSESAPFETATVTFEKPPHLIEIVNSTLPNILAGNAEVNIVDSKIGILKFKKLAHLDRLYNSEVAGIKNTI